jgi:hypothetical protein
MTHPDDDTMLQAALELLDEFEASAVRAHLASCGACRLKHAAMAREIDRIASLEPRFEARPPMRLTRRLRSPGRLAMMAAAVVLIFALGFGCGMLAVPAQVTVVEQRFIPSGPRPSNDSFTICERLATMVIPRR